MNRPTLTAKRLNGLHVIRSVLEPGLAQGMYADLRGEDVRAALQYIKELREWKLSHGRSE